MDVPEEGYSFDLFLKWSADALKDYCGKRGMPVSGTKQELAAMAYTAYRMKTPVEPSELDKIHMAKTQYLEKLKLTNGQTLKDPLKDTTGWEGEVTGIPKWPNITHGDIVLYFNGKRGIDSKETLNKYKEGKAFSFYSSNFVKEVMFKVVADDLCILKTAVTPSARINDPPHHVWACATRPGGSIQRAYCSCTAGYVPLRFMSAKINTIANTFYNNKTQCEKMTNIVIICY